MSLPKSILIWFCFCFRSTKTYFLIKKSIARVMCLSLEKIYFKYNNYWICISRLLNIHVTYMSFNIYTCTLFIFILYRALGHWLIRSSFIQNIRFICLVFLSSFSIGVMIVDFEFALDSPTNSKFTKLYSFMPPFDLFKMQIHFLLKIRN